MTSIITPVMPGHYSVQVRSTFIMLSHHWQITTRADALRRPFKQLLVVNGPMRGQTVHQPIIRPRFRISISETYHLTANSLFNQFFPFYFKAILH